VNFCPNSCSALLIPGDPEVDEQRAYNQEIEGDHSFVCLEKDWLPGRFSCPLVFKHLFHLHWRLKPQVAISSVVDSLSVFGVMNRKSTLVFQSATKSIFYMVFSYPEVDPNNDSPGSMSNSGTFESLSDFDDMGESQEYFSPVRERQRKASSPSRMMVGGNLLLLEVYGVDVPGREITEEFVSLVESKIDAILLTLIGTLLSRNTSVKLSRQDIKFLLPIGSTPNTSFFPLPTVENPFLYLMLLRQNLLSLFNAFTGNNISKALRRKNSEAGGALDSSENNEEEGYIHLFVTDQI
jgi:hypothetical protein